MCAWRKCYIEKFPCRNMICIMKLKFYALVINFVVHGFHGEGHVLYIKYSSLCRLQNLWTNVYRTSPKENEYKMWLVMREKDKERLYFFGLIKVLWPFRIFTNTREQTDSLMDCKHFFIFMFSSGMGRLLLVFLFEYFSFKIKFGDLARSKEEQTKVKVWVNNTQSSRYVR